MTDNLTYRHGIDNIFDFHFMEDFTTILALKDDGIDTSNLKYEDEDDFYCFSEKKVFTESEIFKKFNIQRVAS